MWQVTSAQVSCMSSFLFPGTNLPPVSLYPTILAAYLVSHLLFPAHRPLSFNWQVLHLFSTREIFLHILNINCSFTFLPFKNAVFLSRVLKSVVTITDRAGCLRLPPRWRAERGCFVNKHCGVLKAQRLRDLPQCQGMQGTGWARPSWGPCLSWDSLILHRKWLWSFNG